MNPHITHTTTTLRRQSRAERQQVIVFANRTCSASERVGVSTTDARKSESYGMH